MITPDKKTKRKNILTALAIIAFMILISLYGLYQSRNIYIDILQVC